MKQYLSKCDTYQLFVVVARHRELLLYQATFCKASKPFLYPLQDHPYSARHVSISVTVETNNIKLTLKIEPSELRTDVPNELRVAKSTFDTLVA